MVPQHEPFSVSVERRDDAVIVSPAGELDIATVDEVSTAIAEHEDAASHLVLDLSRLTFLDTSGMRLVLMQREATGRAGRSLALVAGPPQVQRLFEIAGVLDRLPFAPSLDDALARR